MDTAGRSSSVSDDGGNPTNIDPSEASIKQSSAMREQLQKDSIVRPSS